MNVQTRTVSQEEVYLARQEWTLSREIEALADEIILTPDTERAIECARQIASLSRMMQGLEH